MTQPYTQKLARLTIGSLDDIALTVSAQYNPKEIEVTRNVPWKPITGDNKQKKNDVMKQINDVEFTGGEGRTMSLELFFDGFEENHSVAMEIEMLDQMACVRDGARPQADFRRPHQCVVVWGGIEKSNYIPAMRCVIESIAVKYTMFDSEGRPVRAVANLKLREAIVKKAFDDASIQADSDQAAALAGNRVWRGRWVEKKEGEEE